MDGFDVQLSGLDEVIAKMRRLPVDVRQKGGRFAGRKASNLIRDAAIQNAEKLNDPATAEEIAKNLAVRFSSRTLRRTGDIAYRVGILGGARRYANTRDNRRKRRVGLSYKTDGSSANPGGDTFYWTFLEFGTQKMRARPFMRPAGDTAAQPAADEFTSQLNRWLDRYYARSGIVPPDL